MSRARSRARHPDEFIAGDALRGYGALWVFAFHVAFLAYVFHVRALPAGSAQPTLVDTFGWVQGHLIGVGATSVEVFFVLSGYLLGRPYVRSIIEATPLPAIGDYFWNRALRIVPIFWIAIVIALVHYGSAGATLSQIAGMFAFVQTYLPISPQDDWLGQAWTLDIEVGFYIVLPLGALFAAGLLRGRLGRGGRALALLAGLVLLFGLSREAVHFHVAERTLIGMLFAFLPGIALAVVEPFAAPWAEGRRGVRWAALALGVAGVALLAAWELADPIHFNVRALLAAAGSGATVAAPLLYQWATGRCPWVYDNAAIRWVGERSYSFYLLHLFAIYDVTKALGGGHSAGELALLAALPSLLASLAIAGVGYRFVERPCLRLRSRWRARTAVAA